MADAPHYLVTDEFGDIDIYASQDTSVKPIGRASFANRHQKSLFTSLISAGQSLHDAAEGSGAIYFTV
jgi:hypothetical protein